MNKLFLSGRLTREPEMKKTQSGVDFCNISIAVQRPNTKKEDKLTDFFNCTIWGSKDGPGRAGVIQKYFHKGDGITLTGAMISHKYTDKDGKEQTGWTVNVDDFEFPMGKASTAPQEPKSEAKPVPIDTGEEGLPF